MSQIFKYSYKYIICFVLGLGWSIQAWAQVPQSTLQAPQDSAKQVIEPIKYKKNGKPKGSGFMISGLRVGTDLLPLITQAADKKYNGYIFYSDLMIRNSLFITFEYGEEGRLRDENLTNYTYKNEGNFFTFGVEYNLIKRSSIHDAIYLGLKYTISNFDQEAEYFVGGSDYWNEGGQRKEVTETGLTANWFELAAGVKLRIWKGLYIDAGLSLLVPNQFPVSTISITDMPGYGFVKEDQGKLTYHYRLSYKIPLGKIYVPPTIE